MSAPIEPPTYKGEPLDAERGPGLGCFWIQVGLLAFFLVLTPLTVVWAWDSRVSAVLLIFTLILLLFTGQTVIFLLRLVAADRRTRRAPRSPDARPTVGQIEDQAADTAAVEPAEPGGARAEHSAAPVDHAEPEGAAGAAAPEGAARAEGRAIPDPTAGADPRAEPERPAEPEAPTVPANRGYD